MRELLEEYGSAVIACSGTLLIIHILKIVLFSPEALLGKMILHFAGGGI